MHQLLEKIEQWNARLIPYAIIALLLIIIYELFLHIENHLIEVVVYVLDAIVITIFVIDLFFLALRARSTSYFFKNYWLDIIAVFPFALFFNAIGRLYKIVLATEQLAMGQTILHETLEAEKGIKAVARSGRLARTIRIIARLIRVVTKSRLFTHFHAQHHLAKRNIQLGRNMRKEERENARREKAKKKRKRHSKK
jgi:hypothetical protein